MNELYTNVNWLAVITGAVLAFALGGLWYSSKMFGTRWAEGSHLQPLSGPPVPALLVQGVGIFLLAWLIGVAIANSAWWVALLIILTCTIILAGSCLFSQKSSYAVATESGFVVTNGAIMLVCQFLL